MHKRSGLSALAIGALVVTALPAGALADNAVTPDYEPTVESLQSHPVPAWYNDAKFGIFVHWGPYSVPAWGARGTYAEWYRNYMDTPGNPTHEYHRETYGKQYPYDRFAQEWAAEKFEPEAWADLFEQAGAQYTVLTSKHHDGVALFDSAVTGRDAVDLGPSRDLAGELFGAIRERTDLRAGFYYSLLEWDHPDYAGRPPTNPYTGKAIPYVGHQPVDNYVEDHMHAQMRELIKQYDPDIMWCDGQWEHDPEYWDLYQVLADYYNQAKNRDEPKDVVVANRCNIIPQTEGLLTDQMDFLTPEYEALDEVNSTKWESSRGIGHSYGFNQNEPIEDYLSSNEIVDSLVDIVSKNGNLLLNVGPKGDGTIPKLQAERLRDIGEWLDINSEAIYGTTYWSQAQDDAAEVDVRYTLGEDALYVTALDWPGERLTLSADIPMRAGTNISLLGSDQRRLPWNADDGVVTIDLPDTGETVTSSEHAYTFKIEIPGARQLMRMSADAPDQVPSGESFTTEVEVYNHSEQPSRAGTVHVEVPAGWTTSKNTVAVPALGSRESHTVSVEASPTDGGTIGLVEVGFTGNFGALTYSASTDPVEVVQ